MKMMWCRVIALIVCCWASAIYASLSIPVYSTSEYGRSMGEIIVDDTIYGLMFTPHLHGLSTGVHGFHIHEGTFCGGHGNGAGGHLDPGRTYEHRGPYMGGGHLGDLPLLIVNANGHATLPVLAPRLRLNNIKGYTIVVNEEGDNYMDKPDKLGGGGARVACGVIPYFN